MTDDLSAVVHARFPNLIEEARAALRRHAEPVPPCARCGDPGGRPSAGCTRPGRIDGARWGIEGGICLRCRQVLVMRERRGQEARS